MLTSVFIIAISVVLLVYWLRYSCVLLLRSAQERKATAPENERFALATVIERLKTENELDPLEAELERDYQVVSYLIAHAADLELASVENKVLVLDYKVMRAWSRATRSLAPAQSRRALIEMAAVLQALVSQMSGPRGLQFEV